MTSRVAKFKFPSDIRSRFFYYEGRLAVHNLLADNVNGLPVIILRANWVFGGGQYLVLFGSHKIWVGERYLELE